MLDENQIIEKLCVHLGANGYDISQRLHTTQQGIDVIALHRATGSKLLIEAKGETSSRLGSNRFSKPYTNTQVLDRVAKGFYTVSCLAACSKDGEVAVLALPDRETFIRYVHPVLGAAKSLGILIYLVSEMGSREYSA